MTLQISEGPYIYIEGPVGVICTEDFINSSRDQGRILWPLTLDPAKGGGSAWGKEAIKSVLGLIRFSGASITLRFGADRSLFSPDLHQTSIGKPHGRRAQLSSTSTMQEDQAPQPGNPSSPGSIYSPLENSQQSPSIRLLSLKPGDKPSPISAIIKSFPLWESPAFEALSYCWGDPFCKVSITCNGAILHITGNLDSALRHLRQPDSHRMLWIDALCINQEDLLERSQQVAIMRHIYRQADEVIVWLGEEDRFSRTAFAACTKIVAGEKDVLSEMLKSESEAFRTLGTRGPGEAMVPRDLEDSGIYHGDGMPQQTQPDGENGIQDGETHNSRDGVPDFLRFLPREYARVLDILTDSENLTATKSPTSDEVTAIHTLLRRPWFSRVWIVQEVSVDTIILIMCGSGKIDWWDFFLGFWLIVNSSPRAHSGRPEHLLPFHSISNTRYQVQNYARGMDDGTSLGLLALLLRFRQFHATDPRDKVSSMLPVFEAWAADEIRIRSLPFLGSYPQICKPFSFTQIMPKA